MISTASELLPRPRRVGAIQDGFGFVAVVSGPSLPSPSLAALSLLTLARFGNNYE